MSIKKLGIAGLALIGLTMTSSVASAQLCVVTIMAQAIYTGATENRELTQKEALSCGLIRDSSAKPGKKKVAKRTKKTG